ncbi:hypothetical protein K439DRAFT_1620068 [Ramaria rubella]|nr:hypothetical protein K439DRAFT_1620068 [Ramaria rubella]
MSRLSVSRSNLYWENRFSDGKTGYSWTKAIGFGTPQGSLGLHWGLESGGKGRWPTWNGWIWSCLMNGASVVRHGGTSVEEDWKSGKSWKRVCVRCSGDHKKCTKPGDPMFVMEMEGKTSLLVQYRVQPENTEAGPGPVTKRQRSEQAIGEARGLLARFADLDVRMLAEKGKSKEHASDVNWAEEGSEEAGFTVEICGLRKTIHNLVKWLRYHVEGMASLNDSLKTSHRITEVDYKFWRKWWETYNRMFAQEPEVESEGEVEDAVGKKPTEAEPEEVSEKQKGKEKEMEAVRMDVDVALEVTESGVPEMAKNAKEPEEGVVRDVRNPEGTDLGKAIGGEKEKAEESEKEAKAPEDETME